MIQGARTAAQDAPGAYGDAIADAAAADAAAVEPEQPDASPPPPGRRWPAVVGAGLLGLAARMYPCAAGFLREDDLAAPGCLVVDVRMPRMGGFDLIASPEMRERQLPTIFITGHGDVSMAVRAMKAGAADFLTKPFDDQSLIDAVNAAIRVDHHRRRSLRTIVAARQRLATLSQGEREVIDLAMQGLRNKQIAADLGISEITVKVRRARAMTKLNVASIVGLVRLYDLGVDNPVAEAGAS